jgi:glucan 1,3-beta-glucosidase
MILNGFNFVCQQCSFQNAAVGIDASGVSGSLTVIDSSSSSGTLISSSASGGSAENSIILDNVQNSGSAVTLNGVIVLEGNVDDTWVLGNLVSRQAASKTPILGVPNTTIVHIRRDYRRK